MIGKQIAQFHIVEKLGEGGMGVVYKAEDKKLGRMVALKVLPEDFVGDEERRARFIREARTAAAVTHQNIATIHEINEVEGITFIAMELVEGETLSKQISGRPLITRRALNIGRKIAAGLAQAHRAGIVHRDLKPDNIIIGPEGEVKILDFGLAKLYEVRDQATTPDASRMQTLSDAVTRDGRILGTAAYMSPEQARGLPLDSRSDVFSLGVVLYEMVCGTPPFKGETITDTLSAILRDAQAPIAKFNQEVPQELERIIAKCLVKSPNGRYQSAKQIVDDLSALERISDSQPVPLVSNSGILISPLRRNWVLTATVGAAALTALLLLAFSLPKLFDSSAPVAVEVVANSLAVLPFDNLQRADDPERLGQILQELIITDLSGITDVKVFSSQRLFDLQKQLGRDQKRTIDRDMATAVARRAGAGTMLSGSVSQLGDNWILTSQLVDLSDGTVLKSQRIDGSDLYEMVDDLTHRLHKDLGIRQIRRQGTDVAIKERTSDSLEAYQLFLEGTELLNMREFDRAIEKLQAAITTDPAFGKAYYELATARWWASAEEKIKWGETKYESPGDIIRTLLDGDVKLPEKDRQLAKALLPLVEGRYNEAQPLFEQIVKLYPDEKEGWYGLGEARWHGNVKNKRLLALEAFQSALDLDPALQLANVHMVDLYMQREMHAEGIQMVEDLVARDPSNGAWYVDLIRLEIGAGAENTVLERIANQALANVGDESDQRSFLMGLAKWMKAAGKNDQASHYLDQAIEINPGVMDRELYTARGMMRVHLREYAQAEQDFQRVLESDALDRDALEGMATVLKQQRRYREGVKWAHDLFAETGDDEALFYWLAGAIFLDDDAESSRAMGKLDALIKDDTVEAERKTKLLLRLSDAYTDLGRHVQADMVGKRLIEMNPDTEDARVIGLLAWNALRLSRLDEARNWFDTTLKMKPMDLAAARGLRELNLMQGENAEAIACGERTYSSMYSAMPPALDLIDTYIRTGDLEAAEATLTEAMSVHSSVMGRRYLLSGAALAHADMGRFELAEKLFKQAAALDIEGHDLKLLKKQAAFLLRTGALEKANGLITEALALDRDNPELIILEARLHLLREEYNEANKLIDELLETGPVDKALLELQVHQLLGQGDYQGARQIAEKLLAMDPGRVQHSLLAWTLIAGDLDIALGRKLAEQALAIPPRPNEALTTYPFVPSAEHALGLASLKQGNHEKAVKHLTEARSLRPDRPEIERDLATTRALMK